MNASPLPPNTMTSSPGPPWISTGMVAPDSMRIESLPAPKSATMFVTLSKMLLRPNAVTLIRALPWLAPSCSMMNGSALSSVAMFRNCPRDPTFRWSAPPVFGSQLWAVKPLPALPARNTGLGSSRTPILKSAVFSIEKSPRSIFTFTLSTIGTLPLPSAWKEKSRPTPTRVMPNTFTCTEAPPLSSKMK